MGKTITTHFLEGTPKGIQSLQIGNKDLMAFIIPRAELQKAKELEELSDAPCLYVLIEESEAIKPKVYIGQTDEFFERIYQHNQKKNFWDKVLVFFSQAKRLSKTGILYLEYVSLNLVRESNNYNTEENKQTPKKPNLQRSVVDTLNEFFSDIRFIMAFAGFSLFKSKTANTNEQELFYLTVRNTAIKGYYDENGFTVLKGSSLAPDVVASFIPKEKRADFLAAFTEIINEKHILKSDYTFKSPSTAAQFCAGRSINGWQAWKNAAGKTLDEVFRD